MAAAKLLDEPFYTASGSAYHTPESAAVALHLVVDYLNACNDFVASNGTQDEANECLLSLQRYCADLLDGTEANALDAEDWK